MAERRTSERRRVFKAGKIVFNQAYSVIDCAVHDLSRNGALISVLSALTIPQKFELRWDGHTQRCTVVWRKLDGVGVAFDSARREPEHHLQHHTPMQQDGW